MAYSKIYTRINWVNKQVSKTTPVGAIRLNQIDGAIDTLDDRIIEQETLKLDKATALTMVADWSMDEETGIITITKLNGEKIIFDLNIEKIPVNFELSEDGILTMTTDDSTEFTANIGDMIPVLSFVDSDEITVSVTGEGKNRTYSFSIKAGSVTEDKLQPNFLADIKVESANAQLSAENAAVSEANTKKYEQSAAESAESAKSYAEQAKTVSGEQVALNRQTLGYSKKNLLKNTATSTTNNGITFTVNEDGSITANGTATGNTEKYIGSFVPTPNETYIFDARNGETVNWNYVCYIKGIDGSESWMSTSGGYKFTPATNHPIGCHIYITKGTTLENFKFYPMIRSADITDGTYEPYVDDVDTRLKDVETELGEIPNTYIPKKSILNSQEEIEANTSEESVAGALALKEINNNMGGLRFGMDADGNYGYYKDGADTVTPFKSGGISYIGTTVTDIQLNVTGLKNITIFSSKSAMVRVTYEGRPTKTVSILAAKEQTIDVVGAKYFSYNTNDSTLSKVNCSIR